MSQPAFEAWGLLSSQSKVLTLFSTDLLGPYYVIIMSSICFDHFLAFSSSEWPRTWKTSTLMSRRKKARWDCVCVCNFPSDTESVSASLPGRFLGTNDICSDWIPSPYCRGLKKVLFSPLHPSDCQNPWKIHPPQPIPSSECAYALYFSWGSCHRAGLGVFLSELPGNALLWAGFALHSRVRREATVSWIEHLLPISAVAGPLF